MQITLGAEWLEGLDVMCQHGLSMVRRQGANISSLQVGDVPLAVPSSSLRATSRCGHLASTVRLQLLSPDPGSLQRHSVKAIFSKFCRYIWVPLHARMDHEKLPLTGQWASTCRRPWNSFMLPQDSSGRTDATPYSVTDRKA
jgi:hypothetical protein